ncbi:ADP-ribosylglycohydrolase family protein [Arthrobacter bussei]|uniref:ADP-ribosylglycohydrolase family protein n=1 Tax=Arthrobacter bussei TaxID=2594179 RepID=A0A7X1NM79_9MICC|nr:ADP-ribosylglycohydrolase family protein [Arthrobacter bussei]
MTTDDAASATPTDLTPEVAGAGGPAATYEDRVLGCLLGIMAGDAYGVLATVGDDPTGALGDPADLAVSDATQLTLYTVDGLVDALEWANDGVAADETACLWLAYLRWLTCQGEHLPANAPAPPGRWIDAQEDLLPVHEPDGDTVRALLTGEMGTRSRPVNPQAEGAGALMRSAPFGLVPRIPESMVERLTVDAAALTHGSAAARGTAALFSGIIRALAIDGLSLAEALRLVRGEEQDLARGAAHDAGATGVPSGSTAPVPLTGEADRPGARRGAAGDAATTGDAGDGRVAAAAVAATTADATTTGSRAESTTAAGTFEAALQAVLEGVDEAASPRDQLAAALAHAAAAGRPDASSTIAASLAGGMIGALHGTAALPTGYLDAPGVAAVVRGMARALLSATTGS